MYYIKLDITIDLICQFPQGMVLEGKLNIVSIGHNVKRDGIQGT